MVVTGVVFGEDEEEIEREAASLVSARGGGCNGVGEEIGEEKGRG